MRIGLYMGSFDPLHEGHKLIAKKSLEFVDRVFMIPTGSYWDKSMHHSIDERIRMIVTATPFCHKSDMLNCQCLI